MNLTFGIYPDIPMDDYVADRLCEQPSLSSSLANILIDHSPLHARYAHPRLTPPKPRDFSRVANFGSAVAAMVFGGPVIRHIEANSYASKAAKEGRDEALGNGMIPLLTEEMEAVEAVARVAGEAVGSLLLKLDCEHTIIFRQGDTWCRSRPDAISRDRKVLLDLKVTGTNVRDVNRQFFSQGYDMQAAFMERAADSIDPDNIGRREILYLFVEAEPPHGYAFIEVAEGTRQMARKKMNAAVNLWNRCMRMNEWPGYQGSKQLTSYPSYQETAWLVREEMDPMINVEFPQ